jgi:diadenosine tetraphosphatase ApaH/serine/threonine PP2A family protein phosphatase
MPTRAILSDVHGNLEALQAVLADAAEQGASELYCLGDVVGYGPDPRACLELVRQRCAPVLLGNHDEAALSAPEGFNPAAERAIRWTTRQLEEGPEADGRRAFLAGLPLSHQDGDVLLVHGSARDPVHEYVFPADVYDVRKMADLFARVGRWCFQGHTHVPGVFVELAPGYLYHFAHPAELGGTFRHDGRKTLVNVGSVGQARDGDWRACYALFDGDQVSFRRVPYDVEATISKIRAIADLDPFLGDRLRDGR